MSNVRDRDPNKVARARKERAREQRRKAYLAAKERRAGDPRHIALKEAAKVRRRAVYQEAKAWRKAILAERKTKQKEGQATARAAKAEDLMRMVKLATKPE